jgi:hypothetical protein
MLTLISWLFVDFPSFLVVKILTWVCKWSLLGCVRADLSFVTAVVLWLVLLLVDVGTFYIQSLLSPPLICSMR